VSAERLQILHLEDNAFDVELIGRELTRGGIDAEVTHAASESAFRDALARGAFDVILADFDLPRFDGIAALQIARNAAPGTPFIFVSGAIGEERAILAMQHGAIDYILKDRIARLPVAVRRALAERDAQRALRLSRERFILAAQATQDVIWDWSANDGPFAGSAAMRERRAHVHPADVERVCSDLLAAIASGAIRWESQYRLRRGEAGYAHIRERAILVRDDTGRAVRIVGAMQDITARIEAERKLEQEQRISSLGRVAAVIAHEFNNVLMGIQPFADILRKRGQDDPLVLKSAQYIASAVARGRQITSDILRAANPGEPALETLDLAAWLRDVGAEINGILPPAVRFDLDVAPSPVMARFDPRQMHQVLFNLAINARDAMRESGELRIAMSAAGEDAVIIVSDTGAGISDDVLPRIFDPLFTTKNTGTGLGLAVAKQIIARNGGTIAVDSIVGKGTVFSVTLPRCAAEEVVPEDAVEEAAAVPPSVRRLLIVDDDADVVRGMTMLLELEGFEVHAVGSAAAVEEAVSGFRPDAVILDLTLPDGHGTDVYRSLSAAEPELPVVFASGDAEPPALRDASAEKRVTFLRKPYDVNTLMERLRDVAG
jgi:sigma-B regulation protein RsbU (phosphoserine phosphatase)